MRVRQRRRAGADGLPFQAWAAGLGLVPWDVPPRGRELPADAHGRQALVGAYRGLLPVTERPFVVRQVVLVTAGGARTWWTCAVAEGTEHVACSTEPLSEPEEFDALLRELDDELGDAKRRGVRLVA